MYKISGVLFCILTGFLIGHFGWTAIIWTTLGYMVALFSTANIILPLLMGIPLASPLVKKKLMRPGIFIALFRAPIIWLTIILIIGLLFPQTVEWISKNETLKIGLLFGVVTILFSPFSTKAKLDFREDFDSSYARYYTTHTDFKLDHTDIKDTKQQEQIQAIIKISSNFYLNQLSYSFDILNFKFPDSRFRCMIFCLSTVIKACEDLLNSKESMEKECVHFISYFMVDKENCMEYLNEIVNAEQAEKNAITYFNEFMDNWSAYYDNIKTDDKETATKILCRMIHSIENDIAFDNSDEERLISLSREIGFSFASMKKAFANLTSK